MQYEMQGTAPENTEGILADNICVYCNDTNGNSICLCPTLGVG